MKLLLAFIAAFTFVTFAPDIVLAWVAPIVLVAFIAFYVMVIKASRS